MKLFFRKKDVDKKNSAQSNQKKCKYCDMIFDEEERLRRHVRKAHNDKGGDMPNLNPFGPS